MARHAPPLPLPAPLPASPAVYLSVSRPGTGPVSSTAVSLPLPLSLSFSLSATHCLSPQLSPSVSNPLSSPPSLSPRRRKPAPYCSSLFEAWRTRSKRRFAPKPIVKFENFSFRNAREALRCLVMFNASCEVNR